MFGNVDTFSQKLSICTIGKWLIREMCIRDSTRKQDQEKLLTVCNFSDKNAEVEVPEEFKGAECLITNLGRKEFEGKIVLNPYEAFVLYYKH